MAEVVKVHNGNDWEALYIDGECVKQQHLGRIDVGKRLEGVEVESFNEIYQYIDPYGDNEWGEMASYPEKLEDVPNYNDD